MVVTCTGLPSVAAAGRSLAATTVVALAVSCGTRDPCDGLQVGDTLAITIVDAQAGAPDTCTFGFDLSQGEALEGNVVSNSAEGTVCNGSAATIAPFGMWTWVLVSKSGAGNVILSGTYTASNGSCSGVVSVTIHDNGSGPIMVRDFEPTGSGSASCQSCRGEFNVTIQKVSGS
jgi:hypothetical protein